MKVLLCGEGPHDVGLYNTWSDARRDYGDLDGWLQPVVRCHRPVALDFSTRLRKDLQIDVRAERRLRPLPAGHGAKALLAKLAAINGSYDMLVFMVDADSPDPRRRAEIVNEIEDGFARVNGDVLCIPCVPMSASESWIMADPGAWLRAAGYDGAELPQSPERAWGHRDDPQGDHPHRIFRRVCDAAGVTDSRESRVLVAEATEWHLARARCPISLEPFLSAVEM